MKNRPVHLLALFAAAASFGPHVAPDIGMADPDRAMAAAYPHAPRRYRLRPKSTTYRGYDYVRPTEGLAIDRKGRVVACHDVAEAMRRNLFIAPIRRVDPGTERSAQAARRILWGYARDLGYVS